jgi:uncharacterized protein (TIGR02284 family)
MAEEKELANEAVMAGNAAAAQLILGARGTVYPGAEADYWREAHVADPYFDAERNWHDYSPAYELGWTGYFNYGGEFDTADRVLANDWAVHKGVSRLTWDEARPACRAAWQRAHNAGAYVTDGSAAAQPTIAALKEAADNARDGDLGFMEAAAHTATPSLQAFFEQRAAACRESAGELQAQIAAQGGEVAEPGTVTATAHRAWLQIRGLFGGASDETILAECERAEGAALVNLGEVLKQNLPHEIHAMVLRQYECTQRNHDRVKTLLARERAHAEAKAAGAGAAKSGAAA